MADELTINLMACAAGTLVTVVLPLFTGTDVWGSYSSRRPQQGQICKLHRQDNPVAFWVWIGVFSTLFSLYFLDCLWQGGVLPEGAPRPMGVAADIWQFLQQFSVP